MRDTRAVTSPVGYTISIVIALILITGLVVAASNHVTDQRQRTAEAQLDVVGQQVAGSLEAADRLVRSDADDDPDELVLERRLPDHVLGSEYTVEVDADLVRVAAPALDQAVTVEHNADDVAESTFHGGGPIVVEYATGPGELEVSKDG